MVNTVYHVHTILPQWKTDIEWYTHFVSMAVVLVLNFTGIMWGVISGKTEAKITSCESVIISK